MQVENRNNYNTLGQMGPLYPRPEYPPPAKGGNLSPGEDANVNQGKNSSTPSVILGGTLPAKKTQESQDTKEIPAKINLETAKKLASETGELIENLAPLATQGCPHRSVQGYGLLYPTYA
ncbi:MAG: hypothetical protein LBF22_00210 [Deltaproteobacteria bacterium]|jgi:hypothetical protein|nr:hypothetical protein [Deltaproteobacteria bacterium]